MWCYYDPSRECPQFIITTSRYRASSRVVTKRRNSWACIGNPNPEQETIKGTHAQDTSAYQRRPTTQHAAQGSNPPVRALYMQLAKIPHTHLTTPPATSAASADQHGTHRGVLQAVNASDSAAGAAAAAAGVRQCPGGQVAQVVDGRGDALWVGRLAS